MNIPWGLIGRLAPWAVIIGLVITAATLNDKLKGAREDVGEWREKHNTQVQYAAGLKVALDEANAKITSTAKAGEISFGHCQALAATDVNKAFDTGVIFGKATCAPKPVLPSP